MQLILRYIRCGSPLEESIKDVVKAAEIGLVRVSNHLQELMKMKQNFILSHKKIDLNIQKEELAKILKERR